MGSNVVLVTGGCGFLGQHLIKHLQLYADDIVEIKVLDLIPFEKKLEYEGSKRVRSIVGDITDKDIVQKACAGVHAVFHLASKIDVSLFPDTYLLHKINVIDNLASAHIHFGNSCKTGKVKNLKLRTNKVPKQLRQNHSAAELCTRTENIINSCKHHNVQILIYCGSLGSFYGYDEIKGGTETSVRAPKTCSHGKYGETKGEALELVMNSNGYTLRNGVKLQTAAILPPGMFGELDPHNLGTRKSRSTRNGIYYRIMGKMESKIQYSYAGNVSYMFVKAYSYLRKNSNFGGHYFFAADDTPVQTHFEFRKSFISEKIKVSSWYIPETLICALLSIIYCVLLMVRLFKQTNLSFSSQIVYFMNTTFYIKYDKAGTLLGYTPLYDYETSVKRTIAGSIQGRRPTVQTEQKIKETQYKENI